MSIKHNKLYDPLYCPGCDRMMSNPSFCDVCDQLTDEQEDSLEEYEENKRKRLFDQQEELPDEYWKEQ